MLPLWMTLPQQRRRWCRRVLAGIGHEVLVYIWSAVLLQSLARLKLSGAQDPLKIRVAVLLPNVCLTMAQLRPLLVAFFASRRQFGLVQLLKLPDLVTPQARCWLMRPGRDQWDGGHQSGGVAGRSRGSLSLMQFPRSRLEKSG